MEKVLKINLANFRAFSQPLKLQDHVQSVQLNTIWILFHIKTSLFQSLGYHKYVVTMNVFKAWTIQQPLDNIVQRGSGVVERVQKHIIWSFQHIISSRPFLI